MYALFGWLLMIIPVAVWLGFNFSVFSPGRVSAIFMIGCVFMGLSMLFRLKDIGGVVCILIALIMLVLQSQSFFVMAWGLLIFGGSHLIASLTFFKLAKVLKERAFGHPIP